jgi:DNA-binding winged helix-turn-helix (wHTH) protein
MEKATSLYVFRHEDAEFCYDSDNLRLMKGSTRISLEHKPREVLAHLLKNPQKLIRYQELKTAVWGKTHVEDASVHNAVSKVNVALKRAQPGADFIRTVPGVGVEILVDVDPAPAMEDKGDGATEAIGQESAVRAEPPLLTIVGSKLLFRVKWTEPPYTTLTLHVDQPLFEKFPGDWFYRGEVKGPCPQLYVLLLSGPGIRSVMRESPYELLMGKAELAQYDVVAAHIHEALRTATGIQDISCADGLAPAASPSRSPGVPAQETLLPTAYTDGDWITAALVGPERAEDELKRIATAARYEAPRSEHPDLCILGLLDDRIDELLGQHAKGGTTNEARSEACTAKVVSDLLERQKSSFIWNLDEHPGADPVSIFRSTVKEFIQAHKGTAERAQQK